MDEFEFSNIQTEAKDDIKKFIKNDIPKMNIKHKLYIYDATGSILFKNKWETLWKMFDTSSKIINAEFIQVLQFIKLYNTEEKADIINIIFQTVLNSLVNDQNSKNYNL